MDSNYYNYADSNGTKGLAAAVRQLFYDFHSLMNDEISYNCLPSYVYNTERFLRLSETELKELDCLTSLMFNPDENYSKLKEIWNITDKYRIMCSEAELRRALSNILDNVMKCARSRAWIIHCTKNHRSTQRND